MFMAIAVALVAIAIVVFVRDVDQLVQAPAGEPFAVTVTRAVNSVLFIVVVLELVRTIIARLEGGGFQLQPFLVIGIISATRDILTVGAELSLAGAAGGHDDRAGRQRRRGRRPLGRAGAGAALRPAGPGLSGRPAGPGRYERSTSLSGAAISSRGLPSALIPKASSTSPPMIMMPPPTM
jgi:Phosphate-starvation-inducible E family